MFPVTAVVNALPRVCVRRWCRQWTTCCDLRPWNHGRTWTAQSRPTLPPCYWTSWKKELSCLPTTCMGIAFQTEHPVLVRKKITSGGNYVEYMMVWPLFVELKFLLDVLWQRRGLKKMLCDFFFFSSIRSRGACSEHRDGPAGLVLPTELRQRQHHPALSFHDQTVQSKRSAALTQPRRHPWKISLSCVARSYVSICIFMRA